MSAAEDIAAELAAIEAALERAEAEKRANRWCPHTPTARQAEFLALDDDDGLFGGAAGGGKSDSLLMDVLEGADVPGYGALVIRRTHAELALKGAIMDRAGEWLRPTAAHWNDQAKRWTFPSGATLEFGYMDAERDKGRYQGGQWHRIAVDELTQFDEDQYLWLRSRLRRDEGFPIRPHSRAASNPGGRGHRWVHARYVNPDTAKFPFVPALIVDNPHIDQEDYTQRLMDLDSTTRAQLLDGLWVQDSQGLIYPYTAANLSEFPPDLNLPGWHYVLAVDLGASEEKPTTAFSVLAWNEKVEGVWVLQSEKRAGMIPYTIAQRMMELGRLYGGFSKQVMDEGALGKGYAGEFRQRYAIPVEPAEKQSKLGFRKLLRGELERGLVQVVKPANAELLEEMGELRWNEDGTDNEKGVANHLTDTLLYGWRACRAFAAEPPDPRPAPGTREAAEAEARRIEEEEIAALERDASRPWWQR